MEQVIRILIVDDDEPTLETLQDILEHEGYKVTTASTAKEAIEQVDQHFCHILLIDINLPDQSGIEVLHQLKQLQPEAEAVMVTGHASLENALQSFENASAYVEKPVDIPGLLAKIQQLSEKQIQRLQQKQQQEKLEQELAFYRELSHTDPLTHLYNARYFRSVLAKEIRRARRYSRSIVVLMMDIDQFKAYNDRYGHIDADDALVELGRIFQKSKRASDLVARLGGEEFAFLLPETDSQKGYKFAERIRNSVAEAQFPLRDTGYGHLTLSIGVAEFPRNASEDTELMHCADQALYVAKRAGRNQTQVYHKPNSEN